MCCWGARDSLLLLVGMGLIDMMFGKGAFVFWFFFFFWFLLRKISTPNLNEIANSSLQFFSTQKIQYSSCCTEQRHKAFGIDVPIVLYQSIPVWSQKLRFYSSTTSSFRGCCSFRSSIIPVVVSR